MWTEPRHVRDVAAKLAELHETTPERVEEATTANLLAMLGERRAVVERRLGLPAETAPRRTRSKCLDQCQRMHG